jgi:hypothetical protein
MSDWVEMSELLNPTGLKGLAERVLELNKEINCFAGYEAQNVLRDEKKILCVFLTVKESRSCPGLGPGLQGQGFAWLFVWKTLWGQRLLYCVI